MILVFAFVLIPVLAGIVILATTVHVYIGAQAAAASGARAAGSSGGFGPAELTRVEDELRGNGVDPANCTVTASSRTVALDQPISITVDCPQHIGIPFIPELDAHLSSTFVARGEVNR